MQFLSHPKFQAFDSNGDLLGSGKLHTYEPGTTTNKATYPTIADALAQTNANANPVILDSRGEADVVLIGNTKLVLKDSSDNTIWTLDNVHVDDTILDDNGNELIKWTSTSSAVNEITIANAATNNSPVISATGGDTNIGLVLRAKGSTGILELQDGNSNELLKTSTTSSAINEFTIANAATTDAPTLSATGDDDNIDIDLTPKGTGGVNITTGALTVTSGAVTMTSGDLTLTSGDIDLTSGGIQFGATDVFIQADSSTASEIRLLEDTDNGSNYMGIKAPAAVTSSTTLTLPDGDGDANQIIQTDGAGTLSWTSATGQGYNHITTTTLTATGNVNFDNTVITSDYLSYLFIIEGVVPDTDGDDLRFVVSTNNGSSVETSNYRAIRATRTTSTNTASGGDAESFLQLTGNVGSDTNERVSGFIHLLNPTSSSHFKLIDSRLIQLNTAAETVAVDLVGEWSAETAINYVRFYFGTGSFEATGKIHVFGLPTPS